MENTTGDPVFITDAVVNFLTATASLENVVTAPEGVYNPADYGVYGYYPPLEPLLSFILAVMTIWSVFGNGCLLYLVCTEKNMREPGNIFLCVLALTDIAQILVYAPTTMRSLAHGEIPVYLHAGLWTCRFIHIAFPLRYASMMTKRRLAVAMTVCALIASVAPMVDVALVGTVQVWTMFESSVDIAQPLSIMLPCIFGGQNATVYTGMVTTFIGVAISSVAAALICKVAWDNERRHTKLSGIAKDQFDHKLKAAKTLMIITGIQLFTWLPGLVTGFLLKGKVIGTDVGLILSDIFFVVMMTSTFTDSIVFAMRKNIYRRAVSKIYGKIRERYQRSVGPDHIPMGTLRRTEKT
uniref:G-protein coupled receptors family 1 profile domain-containing protein n=1 Tax=Branchiostoma floridae TaxID=7739 RepID=C3XPP4_BRAFL|eukprot:XP_002613906.1 hypothetical protein BRAFLDRAFT_98519 [Branchiostoma floridae]